MYGDIVYAMLADRADASPAEPPSTTGEVTWLRDQMDHADLSHGLDRMPEPQGRSRQV